MRVVKVTKLEEKYQQWDISTGTETFYVKSNDTWILIHNSPSFIMGTHPQTGKFFVASKSAFNKDPKINYTEADIDRNHGHAPGLVAKLKQLLAHGHKLGVKGVAQGDFLYDDSDKTDHGQKISFKPNTIRYSIDKNSPEGEKISKSKIGVALHTRYENDKSVLDPNIEHIEHPDVYVMPVAVDKNKMNFDHEFIDSGVTEIGKKVREIPADGWSAVTHESIVPHVKTYINSEISKGNGSYSVEGLQHHVAMKYAKEIDKVKTDKTKKAKEEARDDLLKYINANSAHFAKAFEIQQHINHIKHHIIDRLNANQTFDHSYESGEKAAPEGYVAISHHGPLKFVNRLNFSRANFQQSANR
jgi:hypothetical protein